MIELRNHKADGYGIDSSSLPKSAVEARRVGSMYFFTGKPCKHSHVAARFTKGGSCTWCVRSVTARKFGHTYTGVSRKAKANAERAEAAKKGNLTYVSSKPCPKGHSLRWTSSTNCVECDRLARERRADKLASARIKKVYGLDEVAHEQLFVEHKTWRVRFVESLPSTGANFT